MGSRDGFLFSKLTTLSSVCISLLPNSVPYALLQSRDQKTTEMDNGPMFSRL